MSSAFVEGLITTAVGMLTVFIVLIMLSFVLYLLRFLNTEKKQNTVESQKEIETEVIVEDKTDDLEIVAVITAAVAASMNTTVDEFYNRFQVKSIVKVQNWNSIARKEHQRNIL